ncbi:MAG: nucleotidyltransferase [Bacteroidetes bacterium]|nr:MAG: nucleotidyltransferase [Bacteroidota bacterium]
MKPTTEKMIAKIRAYFADKPIVRAYLFGSYSRGEEKRGSDVDLLVELEPINDITLFTWAEMEEDLEKIIRKKVDMGDVFGLSKFIKPYVEKDRILIYER